jgi:hypothetical protein
MGHCYEMESFIRVVVKHATYMPEDQFQLVFPQAKATYQKIFGCDWRGLRVVPPMALIP